MNSNTLRTLNGAPNSAPNGTLYRSLFCATLALGACGDSDTTADADATDTASDVGVDTQSDVAIGADAGTDTAGADAMGDTQVTDAAPDVDAAADTAVDAPSDTTSDGAADDVANDAGVDTGDDAGADTGDDAGADTGDATDEWCADVTCGTGACDPSTGTCACPAGTWFDGLSCADVMPCDGDTCADLCPIVRAPSLRVLTSAESLTFTTSDEALALQVGIATDPRDNEPDAWRDGDTLTFTDLAGADVRVFARVVSDACTPRGQFNAIVRVRDTYPGPPSEEGSTAIPLDHATVLGWATTVFDSAIGDTVDEAWRDTSAALGAAQNDSFAIVSLGDGGYVTLGFAAPITDGPGFDLAVFENGFADNYLELASVEVSSDGVTFAAFDHASTNDVPPGPYGYTDTHTLGQLAGKYRAGFGTPFDLAQLRQHPAVAAGELDLSAVLYVRVRDVVGDGFDLDAFGRAVLDPYPTQGSTGFDLDAVAVLGEAP